MDHPTSGTEAKNTVDLQFWGQMSGWTTSEAAALLLDLDPDHLPECSSENGTAGWKYRRLLRLLDRACDMDELTSPMTPREFLQWAASNGLKPPDGLRAIVIAGKPQRDWRRRYNRMRTERNLLQNKLDHLADLTDEPNPKARASFLIIIGGLARAKLGHKRGSPKTAGLIEKAISDANGKLARNTILGCVAQADDYFEEKFPYPVK